MVRESVGQATGGGLGRIGFLHSAAVSNGIFELNSLLQHDRRDLGALPGQPCLGFKADIAVRADAIEHNERRLLCDLGQ